MSGLVIAVPSKGRLKEQVDAWLADSGLKLEISGGARGYMAVLKGLPGAQVRLLSASDIADALERSGVPFVFATGYDADSIPERYANVPRCYKPIDADAVAQALGRQLPRC